MIKKSNLIFPYQVFVTFWMLAFIVLGFITVWILFFIQKPVDKKVPGIDIKEF